MMKRFLLIGIPFLFFAVLGLNTLYTNQLRKVTENMEKKQEEIIHFGAYQFETLFEYMFNDLNLIRFSNEFDSFVIDPDEPHLKEVQAMFLRVLRSKPNLLQIRFLDMDGNEIAKAVSDSQDGISLIPSEELENKSNRYYFQSLLSLPADSLYISDFDLNVENGILEFPYQPTIRFAIAVDSPSGREGFLIINFSGFSLLDFFDDYDANRAEEINIGILDNNHVIGLNTLNIHDDLVRAFAEGEKEVRFLIDNIDQSEARGRFDMDGIRYYYSLIGNEGKDPDIDYDDISGSWVLISSYDTKQIISEYGNFYIQYPSIRIFIAVLAAVLIWLIIYMLQQQEADKLLLLASGYVSDFSHDGVIIADKNKRIIYCNPVFEKTFGYQFKKIEGKKLKEFLNGSTAIVLEKGNITEWEGNVWDESSNNVHIQRYLRIKTVTTSDNQAVFYIGIYSEPKIHSSSVADGGEIFPSSLLNEDSLYYLIPQLQEGFDQSVKRAVIVIRIADLMALRIQLTDHEEQSLIGNISDKLRKIVSADGMISSPSSGLLLLSTVLTENEPLEMIMQRIDLAISSYKFSDEYSSINYISGVAISPDHGTSGKELITNAYIALEALRKVKSVKYLLYNQEIFETVRKHQLIKKEIKKAFASEEFHVVYQTQNASGTLRPIGAEALVRWKSDSLGDVSPALFVPIMEESSQIKLLGKYILQNVLEECKLLPVALSENFVMSVNLSSQEFSDDALIMELIEMIKDSGFPPGSLCFEITETVLSENLTHTNHTIELLHRNGIPVAIDDFGTGYSSLSYLKNLQADMLKIDRMFIKEFPDRDDGAMLRAITNLAHEIDMKIIVEGVETEEQLAFIRELNCPQFQGYYVSRPVRIQELIEQIKE